MTAAKASIICMTNPSQIIECMVLHGACESRGIRDQRFRLKVLLKRKHTL
jgi:hypothetical protein